MDSLQAFANGEAARQEAGAPSRVFDWRRAAELIRDRKPEKASAGLGQDWFWTGGGIYADGAPVPREATYTYLSSNWAIPEVDMDGDVQPCWIWKADSPGWDASTYWPDEALAILNAIDGA